MFTASFRIFVQIGSDFSLIEVKLSVKQNFCKYVHSSFSVIMQSSQCWQQRLNSPIKLTLSGLRLGPLVF